MIKILKNLDRLSILTGLIVAIAVCESFHWYGAYEHAGKSLGGTIFSIVNSLALAAMTIYFLQHKNKFGYAAALAYSLIELIGVLLFTTTFYVGTVANRHIYRADIVVFVLTIPAIIISYKFLRFFMSQEKIMRSVSNIDLVRDYDSAFRFTVSNHDPENPVVRNARSHLAWDRYEMHRRNRNVLPLIQELEKVDDGAKDVAIERLAKALDQNNGSP